MKNKSFCSFKEAKGFASALAEHTDMAVSIKNIGNDYVISTLENMPKLDVSKFRGEMYSLGGMNEEVLSFVEYLNTDEFLSKNLAWHDLETDLVWDSARLVDGNRDTFNPSTASFLMNVLKYAGLRNWRLPTINELKTLSINKLDTAGINYRDESGNLKIWSCEYSLYGRDGNSFLDIASMQIGNQRFYEEYKNKSTPSDGYLESAQTIMVTSDPFDELRKR